MTHELESQSNYIFQNDDVVLREAADKVLQERKEAGLEGLVGDLACIIICTETDRLVAAAQELQRYTGYQLAFAFEEAEDGTDHVAVMKRYGSADIILKSRKEGYNPFAELNEAPKSKHLPNTRLETFVFETTDLERYVEIQRRRGIEFMTDHIIKTDNYSFIQTKPSIYTHNATGFIQWTGKRGHYQSEHCKDVDWCLDVPRGDYTHNIGILDHAATRVIAKHRDPAILEFMSLTNYDFAFAIYVDTLNSITNVSRLPGAKFALVFTSGIQTISQDEDAGPTVEFVRNYGARVHHLAFINEHIDETYEKLRDDGLSFLSELVGAPEDGIRQTFTKPSENTLLVNEYLYRYNGFDGFFTPANVAHLTASTHGQ